MTHTETVLFAVRNNAITADNAEDGYARIRALAGVTINNAELARAVAACLALKLIHEPIRLPDGALHCHWTLELTVAGAAAARALNEK